MTDTINAESNPVGRPTLFKQEYIEQAKKLCELGAIDEEIANFFNVDVRTIHRWKLEYPEFCHSIVTAREAADNRVERALYHRAIGYSHPEDDIRSVNGQVVITPTIKHYPPDTTAATFWLKNRRKDEWKERVEPQSGDGDKITIIVNGEVL